MAKYETDNQFLCNSSEDRRFKITEKEGTKVAEPKSPNLFMSEVRFDCDQADSETNTTFKEAESQVLAYITTILTSNIQKNQTPPFLPLPQRERSHSTGSKRSLSGDSGDEDDSSKGERNNKARLKSPPKK